MNSSSSNRNLFTEEEDIKYNSQNLFTEEEEEDMDIQNHDLFTEEEDIKLNSKNKQQLFTEEEDIRINSTKNQHTLLKKSNQNAFTEEEDFKLNNQNFSFEEEEEEFDDLINEILSKKCQNLIEEEEEDVASSKNKDQQFVVEEEEDNASIKNKDQQFIEEEEEEDSFEFESTESYTKPSYIDDDHVDLITENDEDTIKLLKKLDNMNLDLDKIENPSDEPQIEEEEEEAEQNQTNEEEDTKDDDTFSISSFDMSISNDTKELFNVIDNLKIDSQPEKERPLPTFDPPLTKEESSTNDQIAEAQFDFQDSFVYRDIEADKKPFKQRGNKRAIYDDLHTFDCVALVVDPSKPENEIDDYVTPDFNQADEAAIITARTKDAPLPDYEILTPYSGEIESLILQAYLDFNDL